MQTKDISICDAQIKMAGDALGFEGYASTFGGEPDSYGDIVAKGAFAETIKSGRTPLMLFGHNPGRVIGKWTGMAEDSKGLHVKGEFTPGHSDAQNVYASLKHGALSGLSIGFRMNKAGFDPITNDDGEMIGRTLKSVDLIEVSVVAMPANDTARVSSVKAAIETIESLADAEAFLRDAGELSRSAATHFVSHMKQLCRSDSGDVAEMKQQLDAALMRVTHLETQLLLNRYSLNI